MNNGSLEGIARTLILAVVVIVVLIILYKLAISV